MMAKMKEKGGGPRFTDKTRDETRISGRRKWVLTP